MSNNKVFEDSEIFFLNFITKYDIILDDNYNKIKNIFYDSNYDIKNEFHPYIDLFSKYIHLHNDINFIYYIIILYYTDNNILLSFIRFYTSKLNNFKLIKVYKIKKYNELINLNKISLINYLRDLINFDEDTVLFFIICIQSYF